MREFIVGSTDNFIKKKILTAKMFRNGDVTEMLVNTSESLFADKILIMAIDYGY